MALDTNSMVMPVAPTGFGGGFGNGFGDGGWWILLLFILLGGWNNNGCGGGGWNNDLYPWMNQSNQVSDGFRDQMMNSTINGIQSSITSGFGDVQNALCSGFAQAEISANARQMADMNQAFAAQTAMSNGFNSLQAQFAQCCCDNRAGLADLRYTVATEACADRSAVNDALRDVLAANTASTQRLLDQLCQDKIDAKNEKIAELQNQLNIATMKESQTAQNALIQQGLTNEVDALYNRLSNCPVPTVPVYGRQPVFNCGNTGCGCGA